jgi:Tol biopolymer transport system component
VKRLINSLLLLCILSMLSSCGSSDCEDLVCDIADCLMCANVECQTDSDCGGSPTSTFFQEISNQTGPFTYGTPENIEFLLSSYNPGDDAVHTLSFDIKSEDLKTLEAVIKYPKEFTFEGFAGITQITSSTGGNSVSINPSINADGTRIAFSSSRDLTSGNPDFNGEIYLFDTTTTTLTQITDSTQGFGSFSQSINADGTRITFQSDRNFTGDNPDGSFEIFLFDTTTSTTTQLTSSTTFGQSQNPSINGDGTQIAFESSSNLTGGNFDRNNEIFFFNTSTTALTQITDSTGGTANNNPSINADGTRITFRSDRDLIIGSNSDLNNEIFLFNTTTSAFTQITNTTGGDNTHPSINADGTHIAFASDRNLTGTNPDGNAEIFLFDTTTTAFTQITNTTGGDNTVPSINADGTHITFTSDRNLTGTNPDGNAEIFLFNTTTDTFTQITSSSNGTNSNPSINADGNRIAFVSSSNLTGSNPDGNAEVFLSSSKEIGTLTIDSTVLPKTTFSIRPIDELSAYADFRDNGFFDPLEDPKVVYSKDPEDNHLLRVGLTEVSPNAVKGLLTAELTFTMNQGIFTNPVDSGTYTISGTFTSVDPTSGGADDGIEPAPLIISEAVTVTIVNIGDVNGDGNINIVDALLIARFSAGLDVPSQFNESAANTNCDTPININIIDALLTARYSAGLSMDGTGWCGPQ